MRRLAVLAISTLTARTVVAADQVNPFGSARGEAAAGFAPLVPGGEPVASSALILEPEVGLMFLGHRSLTTVSAESRLYYRPPPYLQLGRPLILGRGVFAHQLEVSPRLTWDSRAEASYGEVDYMAAQAALDTPLAAGIQSSVMKLFDAQASTGLTTRLTLRHDLGVGVQASHSQSIGNTTTIPTSTSGGVRFSEVWKVDERRSMTTRVDAAYHSLATEPDTREAGITLAYQEALSRRTTWGAFGGASLAEWDGTLRAGPEGGLSISHLLHERPGLRVANGASASVENTFDPSVGRVYPTAAVTVSLRGDVSDTWSLALSADASTALTAEPVSREGADSATSARFSVDHAVQPWLDLSLGVRAATRASHVSQPLRLVDRELWGFVALTAHADTLEDVPTRSR